MLAQQFQIKSMYLSFPNRQQVRLFPAQAIFKLGISRLRNSCTSKVKKSETYAENGQLAQRTWIG